MKYGSKKEAKQWDMGAFQGWRVATFPAFFEENLEIHEKDLRNSASGLLATGVVAFLAAESIWSL
jgi:hypothetical protein